MKKTLGALVLPFMFFITVLAIGCDGDDNPTTASCDKSVDKYEAALNAFMADITNKTKCEALKATLNDLVACPGITAAQKAEYQADVDDIDCN